MGVLGCFGERTAQTYFYQTRRDTREAELLAVVVQRFLTPLVTSTPRSIFSLFKRRPPVVPAARPTSEQMSEWTSMSDFGQKTEVCFSAERGVIRVAGKEFTFAADGGTFVMLLDEDDSVPSGRRMETFTLHVPLRPEPAQLELDRTRYKQVRFEWIRANHSAWQEAVNADETVRAFFRDREDDGPV